MTAAGIDLIMARREAAGELTETFKVYYETKVLVEEGSNAGNYVDTEVTVYAAMRGRMKFPSLSVQEREQGAQMPAVQDIIIKVAVGSTPLVKVGHIWRCTASTVDSSLVGREVRTKGLPQAGTVSNHRYPVEAVS